MKEVYLRDVCVGHYDEDARIFHVAGNLTKHMQEELRIMIPYLAYATANSFPEGPRLDSIPEEYRTFSDAAFSDAPDILEDLQIPISFGTPDTRRYPKLITEIPEIVSTQIDPVIFRNNNSRIQVQKPSFSGYQQKFMGVLEDVGGELILRLPDESEHGNVIIKPRTLKYMFLPENEHFCQTLAGLCGIDVAKSFLIQDCKGYIHYGVERFDITDSDNPVRRVAVDLCTICQKYSNDKYNYTTEKLFTAASLCLNCEDVKRLALIYLFGYVVGNGDMHLKNISVICEDGEFKLAPVYDMLSTKAYDASDGMALPLNGKTDVEPEEIIRYLINFVDISKIIQLLDNIIVYSNAIFNRHFPEYDATKPNLKGVKDDYETVANCVKYRTSKFAQNIRNIAEEFQANSHCLIM